MTWFVKDNNVQHRSCLGIDLRPLDPVVSFWETSTTVAKYINMGLLPAIYMPLLQKEFGLTPRQSDSINT